MQSYFFVRLLGKFVRVDFGDIVYIEAYANYCKIITHKKSYTTLVTLKDIWSALEPSGLFCRIHRSFIVTLAKIDSFSQDNVEMHVHEKRIELPIGDSYRMLLHNSVMILYRDRKKYEPPILEAIGHGLD